MIVQTTNNGCLLNGYIRECIIQQLQIKKAQEYHQSNIKLELNDLLLNTTKSWKEVFVTSSISLMQPVENIYIPDYHSNDIGNNLPLKLIWSSSSVSSSNNKNGQHLDEQDTDPITIWKQLYDNLLFLD